MSVVVQLNVVDAKSDVFGEEFADCIKIQVLSTVANATSQGRSFYFNDDSRARSSLMNVQIGSSAYSANGGRRLLQTMQMSLRVGYPAAYVPAASHLMLTSLFSSTQGVRQLFEGFDFATVQVRAPRVVVLTC